MIFFKIMEESFYRKLHFSLKGRQNHGGKVIKSGETSAKAGLDKNMGFKIWA